MFFLGSGAGTPTVGDAIYASSVIATGGVWGPGAEGSNLGSAKTGVPASSKVANVKAIGECFI